VEWGAGAPARRRFEGGNRSVPGAPGPPADRGLRL